jgi:predicted nucleic acid-binding protein
LMPAFSVKWYISETDSEKALGLRNRHVNGELRLSAPTLIVYETLNALRYSNRFSAKQLKDIAISMRGYGLSLYGFAERVAELTIEAALKNDITIYDASYLALAQSLGVHLITADRRLVDCLTGNYAGIAKQL